MESPEPGGLRVLLDRCHAGDRLAWEEFTDWFDQLAGRLLRYVFPRMIPADRADVAATARERLVAAIRGESRVRGTADAEIKAYCSKVVKRCGLDLVDRQRGAEHVVPQGDPPPQPDRIATARELARKALAIIDSWPAEDRFVFIQKINGVNSARIKAELERPPFCLHIQPATVDTRFWKLRQSLMECLEGGGRTRR